MCIHVACFTAVFPEMCFALFRVSNYKRDVICLAFGGRLREISSINSC